MSGRSSAAWCREGDRVLLIDTVQLWSSHHEIFASMVSDARSSRADITVVRCAQALTSCPANAEHLEHRCDTCRRLQKIDRSLSRVRGPVREIEFRPEPVPDCLVPDGTPLGDIAEIEYLGIPVGALVASQLADNLKDSYAELAGSSAVVAGRMLANANRLVDFALDVIENVKPTIVAAWNGRRYSDGVWLHAGVSRGARPIAFITGGAPDKRLIVPGLSVQEPRAVNAVLERLLASSDRDARRERGRAAAMEIRRGALNQVGFRGFTAGTGSESLSGREWLPRYRSGHNLLVLTSSAWEFIHVAEFRSAFGSQPYREFLRPLEDLREFADRVVVRWHPNLTAAGPFERAEVARCAAMFPAIHVLPEDTLDTYSLISDQTMVYSMGSTVGLIAAAGGLPVLSYTPADIKYSNAVKRLERPVDGVGLMRHHLRSSGGVRHEDAPQVGPALDYLYWLAEFGDGFRPFSVVERTARTAVLAGRSLPQLAAKRLRARAYRLLVACRSWRRAHRRAGDGADTSHSGP